MNGKVNQNAFVSQLTKIVAGVREIPGSEIDFELLETVVNEFMAKQREAAYANPVQVATEILNDPEQGTYYANHKIQAIKVIRDRTCCGLREAKVAYEMAAIPVQYENAKRALKALSDANRAYPLYAKRVWAHDPEFSDSVDTIAF